MPTKLILCSSRRGYLDSLGHETNNITETDVREFKQYINVIKKLSVTSINRKLKSVVRYQNYLNDIGESKNRVEAI
jgi:integrase/recombinase XerD